MRNPTKKRACVGNINASKQLSDVLCSGLLFVLVSKSVPSKVHGSGTVHGDHKDGLEAGNSRLEPSDWVHVEARWEILSERSSTMRDSCLVGAKVSKSQVFENISLLHC
jgi:hypothetical protein